MSDIDQGLKAAGEKLRSILDKRNKGRKLSKEESAFLQSASGENAEAPQWAKNKTELAKICNVSTKTVHRASAMKGWPKPATNGQWPVDKCRAFIEKNFDVLEEQGAAVPEGFNSWQEFRTAEQGMREQVKRLEAQKRVADRAFVAQMISRGQAALYGELRRVFCGELPAMCQGKDPIYIETKNAAALESAFDNFKRGLAEWEGTK